MSESDAMFRAAAEQVRLGIEDTAGWFGRRFIGGRKGVKILEGLTIVMFEESDLPGLPHSLKLLAYLHVTNSASRPLRLLKAKLKSGAGLGYVRPSVYSEKLPPTKFQLDETITRDATEEVTCEFSVRLPRGVERGDPSLMRWTHESRIILIDQYRRKHRTKKLEWRGYF